MGIKISTGFDVGSNEAIDSRFLFKTIEQRDLINTNLLYDGLICYVQETKNYYAYKDSAWLVAFSDLYITKEEAGEIVGKDGKSAYELAKEHGFTGTIEEWIESLKGAPGTQGEIGPIGPSGEQGSAGAPLDFKWMGTQLGVKVKGSSDDYVYTDLGSRSINDARIRSLCGVSNCGAIDCGRGVEK